MARHTLTEDHIQGAVSIAKQDGYLDPWRLPYEKIDLYVPETLQDRAHTTSGVRVRVRSNSERLGLELKPFEADRAFDLVAANERLETRILPAGEDCIEFSGLSGDRVYEIWLPPGAPTPMSALHVADGASCEVAPDDRPRWVTYGSSITHCGGAHSPARTWPAIVARTHDLHLTSLGFGGNCHMEHMVARAIAALPADVITCKIGINIMGGGTLNARTFEAAAVGMIIAIRDGHPRTPLGIVSSIIAPGRESDPNVAGMTLEMMREQLQDAVRRVKLYGDDNLYYFSGLDVLGEDLTEYLPDNVHPNGDGYEILGRNFAANVMAKLPPVADRS